jgi:Plavaka transposase
MAGCFSWQKAVSTFFFSSYQVLICLQDKIAENLTNHGATLCLIILGSDKMTVSVATGHNEYYPLYMSNGLIHNNVQQAHCNGMTLIAFLAILKSKDFVIGYCLLIEFYLVLQADHEHHDSKEFQQFRCNLFHGSIREILRSLGPGMAVPEIILK